MGATFVALSLVRETGPIQPVHGIMSAFRGRRMWTSRCDHEAIADEDDPSDYDDVKQGRELSGVKRILASQETGGGVSARKTNWPAIVCVL